MSGFLLSWFGASRNPFQLLTSPSCLQAQWTQRQAVTGEEDREFRLLESFPGKQDFSLLLEVSVLSKRRIRSEEWRLKTSNQEGPLHVYLKNIL